MGAKKFLNLFILMLIVQLPLLALAQEPENEDLMLFGLEFEKLLAFASAHLAAALALITLVAYFRTNRYKLLFVSLAFFLFSIKLFMISSELFVGEISLIDPLSAALDFVILLSFFYGVIKK
ncbi:MAG: hypothetical protein AABX33_00580 [Nanoarchaeota archaeon]